MSDSVYVSKNIVLESRDFYAETWAKDGTAFHVQPTCFRYDGIEREALDTWWLAHRFDNYRISFKAEDGEYHLECHDETEALSLILNLQQEFNRSLP